MKIEDFVMGKKYRLPAWSREDHVFVNDKNQLISDLGGFWCPSFGCIKRNDWEEIVTDKEVKDKLDKIHNLIASVNNHISEHYYVLPGYSTDLNARCINYLLDILKDVRKIINN